MLNTKSKNIKYRTYGGQSEITRRLKFQRGIAEDLNKLIAVFNHENKFLKLDNSLIINAVLNNYFRELDNKTEDEQLEDIKNKIVGYYGI